MYLSTYLASVVSLTIKFIKHALSLSGIYHNQLFLHAFYWYYNIVHKRRHKLLYKLIDNARKIAFDHNGPQHLTKLK